MNESLQIIYTPEYDQWLDEKIIYALLPNLYQIFFIITLNLGFMKCKSENYYLL